MAQLARLVCAAALAFGASAAPFRLASIFGSGMVLQRDAPLTFWGWARPGATVYASFINSATNATLQSSGVSDGAGAWTIVFPAQPASQPVWRLVLSSSPEDISRCDAFQFYCAGASAELTGLALGDVHLCIGQSNMQVNVAFAFNASAELISSNAYSGIVKIFQVAASSTANDGPLDDFALPPQIPWSPASSTTLPSFSATCWFSAKSVVDGRLGANRSVLLGLIAAPWGGTAIKAHAPLAVNDTCGALYPFPAGKPAGDCGLDHAPCNASTLFNSLIAPIAGPAGFPVSAMTWFQGENDASASEVASGYYACELAALAASLRAAFASPAAVWTTISLAPYTGGPVLGPFREMQCATTWQRIAPPAYCAATYDDGDVLSPIGTVHSRNKQLVGRRVAAGILAAVYGVRAPSGARGPQYAGAALASAPDGTLMADVRFDPATLGGGVLVYAPPVATEWSNSTRCPSELGIVRVTDCDWLSILADDGKSYNATATINADGVTLHLVAHAPPGTKGVGTRNGFGAWPVVSFYNSFSEPVVPWNATA